MELQFETRRLAVRIASERATQMIFGEFIAECSNHVHVLGSVAKQHTNNKFTVKESNFVHLNDQCE